MTGRDDWQDIIAASERLSDDKLLQVLTLIDRLPDQHRPLDVLEAMRPRLARLRPPRRPTLQRLLFRPVEDLFDPPAIYQRRIGRLLRSAIAPCWQAVSAAKSGSLVRELGEALRSSDGDDLTLTNQIGRRLWPAAAEAIRESLAEQTGRSRRDEDLRRQMAEIADILETGLELELTKHQLPPRPIETLFEGHIELLKSTVLGLLDPGPAERVRTFILVICARMNRPGAVLAHLSEMAWPNRLTDQDRIMGEIEGDLVANLVNRARGLNRAGATKPGPEAVRRARDLVEGLASVRDIVMRRNDPAVIGAVAEAETEVRHFLMDSVLGPTDETVRHLLGRAMKHGGGASDAAAEETAETFALSLRHCAQIGRAIGVEREVAAKLAAVCTELEHHALDSGPSAEDRARRLVTSVRMIELIQGPDQAEVLLRRGLERLDGSA